jgi:hypothetical protein
MRPARGRRGRGRSGSDGRRGFGDLGRRCFGNRGHRIDRDARRRFRESRAAGWRPSAQDSRHTRPRAPRRPESRRSTLVLSTLALSPQPQSLIPNVGIIRHV